MLHFTESDLHDKIVSVDGRKFYIQSEKLSSFSEYFRSYFAAEEPRNEIEVEGVSARDFKCFLNLVFQGERIINVQNCMAMEALAEMFVAEKLKELIYNFILNHLDQLDALKLLEHAFKVDNNNLKLVVLFVMAFDEDANNPAVRVQCLICKARFTEDCIMNHALGWAPNSFNPTFFRNNSARLSQLAPDIKEFLKAHFPDINNFVENF